MIAFHRAGIGRQPAMGDLPLGAMKRVACVAVCISILAAGCNVDEGSSTEQTLAPLGTPSNTVPHHGPRWSPPRSRRSRPAPSPLPSGACVFSAPAPTAEVTFEIRTRFYSVTPGQQRPDLPHRIDARQRRTISVVARRRPSATELGHRVRQDVGTPIGFFSTNTGSPGRIPTGTALIAPAVADNHLLWRTAGLPGPPEPTSATLERTDIAAYHPAGRNILAAGQAADGTSGLFVSGEIVAGIPA